MASAAPAQLPMFYSDLKPLNATEHKSMKIRRIDKAPFIAKTHAVPATVDEFALLQRHYPIIFSVGENPVPLALMGLSEGNNVFLDAEGTLVDQSMYVPAYMRRYPFLLARLRQDSDELSLCFDPNSGAIGEFDDGEPLFDGDEPSQATKAILQFCEQFETAGQRTAVFVQEIKKLGLLIDGEVAIQPEGTEQPFIYRGFQMIDEEKLRELRGDEFRKMAQNGMLPLIYAHLFSLPQIREVFSRQVAQGKGPIAVPQAKAVESAEPKKERVK